MERMDFKKLIKALTILSKYDNGSRPILAIMDDPDCDYDILVKVDEAKVTEEDKKALYALDVCYYDSINEGYSLHMFM